MKRPQRHSSTRRAIRLAGSWIETVSRPWLISDEVYRRLVYDQRFAPSLRDLAEPEDKVIVINSFSKTWAMSGWRLGWITALPPLGDIFEKVIEFHYSCPAHLRQLAGIIAVTEGEYFASNAVQRYQAARDLCVERLRAMQRVQLHSPAGAFYLFFAVNAMGDSVATGPRLVAETRVGLALGAASGEAGDAFLRLCFANSTETLTAALDRLSRPLD